MVKNKPVVSVTEIDTNRVYTLANSKMEPALLLRFPKHETSGWLRGDIWVSNITTGVSDTYCGVVTAIEIVNEREIKFDVMRTHPEDTWRFVSYEKKVTLAPATWREDYLNYSLRHIIELERHIADIRDRASKIKNCTLY